MAIINPLTYTIANGNPVDATPVQANFNQIVQNVNANAAPVGGNASQQFLVAPTTNPAGAVPLAQAQQQFAPAGNYAALNGSPNQQFAVANATAANQAVNWSQAGTQVLVPTGNSTITPVAARTLVFPNIYTNATLTINPATTTGQLVRVYGSAHAVTVQSNVSSGFPSFVYPDQSSNYSWTIAPQYSVQFIDLVWDGVSWRCTTEGQIVAAPASASNQVVTLGQFLGPITNANGLGAFAANTTYTCSVSFTAPSAGYVWGQSRLILSSSAASNIQNGLLINGTLYQADSTIMPMNNAGVAQVSQGQSITVTARAVTGTTSPGVSASLYVDAIFIPSLSN